MTPIVRPLQTYTAVILASRRPPLSCRESQDPPSLTPLRFVVALYLRARTHIYMYIYIHVYSRVIWNMSIAADMKDLVARAVGRRTNGDPLDSSHHRPNRRRRKFLISISTRPST